MKPGGLKIRDDLAKPSEDDVQIGLVNFLRDLEARTSSLVFFHVPNGGKRARKTAYRLKRMGTRAGVHDLVFLLPGGVTVWVELKLPGEHPNDAQKEFHARVVALGHRHYIVHAATANEAVTQILDILFKNGLEGVRP